ncbi:MAG: hypothetical protein ACREA0_18390, partial [bacterium]
VKGIGRGRHTVAIIDVDAESVVAKIEERKAQDRRERLLREQELAERQRTRARAEKLLEEARRALEAGRARDALVKGKAGEAEDPSVPGATEPRVSIVRSLTDAARGHLAWVGTGFIVLPTKRRPNTDDADGSRKAVWFNTRYSPVTHAACCRKPKKAVPTYAGYGSWPDAIIRLNSSGRAIQITMSSNPAL